MIFYPIFAESESIGKSNVFDPQQTTWSSALRYYIKNNHGDAYCVNNLVLVHKISNGQPICVKTDTKAKLLKRGVVTEDWYSYNLQHVTNKYKIESGGKSFEIKYLLNGGNLQKIAHNERTNSIFIQLEATTNGMFGITIPRQLLNSTMVYDEKHVEDVDYIILLDGEEAEFFEVKNEKERTVFIKFNSGAKQIEIIGTYPV